jgi:predicted aspartyl protease
MRDTMLAMQLELANYHDFVLSRVGKAEPSNVRRATVQAVVVSGVMRLIIPGFLAEQLGVELCGSTRVRYADGRTADRQLARVHVALMGRAGVFTAIVEPERESAVIGWIVLEDLDLVWDGGVQALVPRDPSQICCEM